MLLASMFCHCICILPIFLYRASLTRPLLSLALSRMAHRIACKSHSCNFGAVQPTENQPNVVLPDLERAAARVKTHVHRKSSQKDSQRSLSSRFTVCAVYTARQFSVRSVSLASTKPWVPLNRLVRESPLAICVCYCISYCISLFHALLSVRPVCAFLQERAISWRTRSLSRITSCHCVFCPCYTLPDHIST